jgi:GT2 family glycosyltransferase
VSAPRLDLVIVAFRSRELLRACLDSIRANPPEGGARVVVVDNASADGTAEMVAREFPEVELIANDRNLGFAAACNRGIASGSAEWVLLLNPDTRITPGSLDVALAAFDERPRVGVVGVRLERPDGSFDHAAKRSFPTPLSALGHFTGVGRHPAARGALAAYRAPGVDAGPVDAVNGAFMLIRREALDQVGGLDEGYWMYMEDLDLCYRLAEAGWTTFYEPGATVIHHKGGTTGANRALGLNCAFHRGMYRFYRQHYAAERPWPVNVAVYLGIGVKLAILAIGSALGRGLARMRLRGPATGE